MKAKKAQIFKHKSLLSSAILTALGTAHAATIQVGGACTLNDAIQAANTDSIVGSCVAGSGADVIQMVAENSGFGIGAIFEPSGDGPGYAGLPVITSDVTLEGNNLTISVISFNDKFRVFDVAASGDFTLRDTTVTGADDGYGVGSGLFSAGRTTIENSTFTDNNGAVFFYNGYGNVISDSVIRHNFNDSSSAAGIQTVFAGVEINQTSVFDNRHNSSPAVRLNKGVGGPVTAGGGVGLFQSQVSISESTISGNSSLYGAGISIEGDNPAPLPSLRPMFEESSLRGVIGSELTLTNSTITNNKSTVGAGIMQFGDQSIVKLQGTIVAGNVTTAGGYAVEGFLVNPSYFFGGANNIIGDNGSASFGNLVLSGNDVSFSDGVKDNLYPLSLSNGQFIHPLRVGSVAIDGNDLSCFGTLIDQDGKGRGIDGDGNGSLICDVGSFEHSLPILADDAPCTLSNAIISANTDTSVGGCLAGNGHDIIQLPENSTQSLDTIQSYHPYSMVIGFGLPAIATAISIEGNGSTIERDASAVDDFDLLLVKDQGQLNLLNSTLTGSTGGPAAIFTINANINLIDSQITGNVVGGLFDGLSVNSSVVGSYIGNNNLINGFSFNYSALTTYDSNGFSVYNSTISNNNNTKGSIAGAFIRGSNTSVINSTISGNTGRFLGGLFISNAAAPSFSELINSTITNNEGGNVGGAAINSVGGGENVVVTHNIISGNSGGSQPIELDASAGMVLDGFNVFGQNGVSGVTDAILGPSDIVPVGATSSVIEALADNGGITPTHRPVVSGEAVDVGSPACSVATDQLGRIRPWDGDSNGTVWCDAGAVELNSLTVSDFVFKDGFDAQIILRRVSKN